MNGTDSFSGQPLVCSIWGEHELAAFDHAVIENSQNGVVACDKHGNLVVFNPTARLWHGLDARSISPREWAAYYRLYLPDGVTLFPPDEIPLARALRGETVHDVPMIIRAEGQPPRYVSCGGGPFFDASGHTLGAFVVLVDTTEIHRLTADLEHLASHDVLTGLPNRRTFEAEVERAAAFAGRGTVSTVLFADVDRFKTCNDLYGHVFGDKVLREIAQRMRAVVRDIDTVARIGGDEFGIVLWGMSAESTDALVTRLSEVVSDVGREHGLDVGLSIGSAAITRDSDTSTVLAEADTRMYEDKRSSQR
ncbi:MAG: diguanylate cyclase [Coriobacteriia bacterium]|nr:diguanylate cyclase [Coriobacteriia bacterium]